uniref:Uncharacterized protein n=1 Tax=Romanomermis culicivorax TaxID=13658 RepID=A0A915JWQ2_ROMCU
MDIPGPSTVMQPPQRPPSTVVRKVARASLPITIIVFLCFHVVLAVQLGAKHGLRIYDDPFEQEVYFRQWGKVSNSVKCEQDFLVGNNRKI